MVKKNSPSLRVIFLSLFFLLISGLQAESPTSPGSFLGFEAGADRKLADYQQMLDYFRLLDRESDSMQLLTIGKSTLGKEMVMAVISSPDNLSRLQEHKDVIRRLRDARGLDDESARTLAREGKLVLLITCSLHATEIAASQMSMELAHQLVSRQGGYDLDKALQDVIVLIVPSSNPDGHQMVCDWYKKQLGTPYEGSSTPWLYHPYAGHDNNRDWFMFNLAETRAVNHVLYHDWIPQIHIDEHQMGATGARLFLPPFMDPPVPTVHPLVWRGVALCGTSMALALQQSGLKGVVYDRSFTGWWIGACDDTSWLHNSIGLLSEMASVKVASPVYVDPGEVSSQFVEKGIRFPDPWPGGWWRLRDLVNYELILSHALVKEAWLHKEDFLFNFYSMCRDGIEAPTGHGPFAFVIPARQRDARSLYKMLDVLGRGGVIVERAAETIYTPQTRILAGDFVVPMKQPYRPYAQALLEKQVYPDMRQYPGGPPLPPYDNAGWTLPMQMGVSCIPVNQPFKLNTVSLDEGQVSWKQAEGKNRKGYRVFSSTNNGSYALIFRLLKEKTVQVVRSKKPVTIEDEPFPAGSFWVPDSELLHRVVDELGVVNRLDSRFAAALPEGETETIKPRRIGIYQSWRSNMDEGWTRYVLDEFGVPYTTLHPEDFTAKGAGLDRFDVILFTSEPEAIIVNGAPAPDSPYARWFTPNPPPYDKGIGSEGVRRLKAFVEGGGVLVALNEASDLVIKQFGAPVQDLVGKLPQDKFFCPTSILQTVVDTEHPLGYGLPHSLPVVFSDSPAFQTRIPSGEWSRNVVVRYPDKGLLLSGWLLGEDALARRAAVVELGYKKGTIALLGIRCQHRGQAHGTFKLLFNALLYQR